MVPVYNRLLHNTADAEKASLPLYNRIRYCTTEPVSQQTGGEAPPVVFLTDSPGKSGRSFPKNWLHICHSLLREASGKCIVYPPLCQALGLISFRNDIQLARKMLQLHHIVGHIHFVKLILNLCDLPLVGYFIKILDIV